MPHLATQRFNSAARAVAGLLALGIAGVVGTGWMLGLPELVQLRPGWAPMQPDSAAGLALAGVGLLLSTLRHKIFAALVGLAMAAAAALVLFEYRDPLDLGIAAGLVTRWIPAGALQPGPMPPNAAVCVLLTGIALVTLRRLPSLGGLSAWARSRSALEHCSGTRWGSTQPTNGRRSRRWHRRRGRPLPSSAPRWRGAGQRLRTRTPNRSGRVHSSPACWSPHSPSCSFTRSPHTKRFRSGALSRLRRIRFARRSAPRSKSGPTRSPRLRASGRAGSSAGEVPGSQMPDWSSPVPPA